MKSFVAVSAFAAAASALVGRESTCCFGLNASGGVSGSVGQLGDGQNRIGDNKLTPAQFCINSSGGIVDAAGRGCILTPPTTQLQCDLGASPTDEFSVGSDGKLLYKGSSHFIACETGDNGGSNIYTTGGLGQSMCVDIELTADGCKGSGCSTGSSSTAGGSSSTPVAVSSSSAPQVPGSGSSAPQSPHTPMTPSTPAQSTQASGPAAPGQSAPCPEESTPAPLQSGPAPTPGYSTHQSGPAPTPEQSGSVPTPGYSVPQQSGPAPTPEQSTPCPCEESTSAPQQSGPAPTPEHSASQSGLVPTPVKSSPYPEESTSAPQQSGPAPTPEQSGPQQSGPAPTTGYSTPQQSGPAPTPEQSGGQPTTVQTSVVQPSGATSSSVSTPTQSSSGSCPTNISGDHELPHLIIPVDSSSPDKAFGTQYNGTVSSTVSTIFNFDIPSSDSGKQCSLIFLFPKKEDLETSSFSFSGDGKIDFSRLSDVASQSTTYSNAPGVAQDYGTHTVAPGNSYSIATFDCPAGEAVSFELKNAGSTDLEFFEDYNPSPIGVFVTTC